MPRLLTVSSTDEMTLTKDTFDPNPNDLFNILSSRLEDINVILPANPSDVNQYWSLQFLVGSPTGLCLTYKESNVIRKFSSLLHFTEFGSHF